jgi:hypothetical protein
LPELDLEPGDYRERKPKGWRWKLPWSHDDDVKLPLVYFVGLTCAGIYVFTRVHEFTDHTWSYAAGGMIGFGLGAMLILLTRR